jgi:guanylate kinase
MSQQKGKLFVLSAPSGAGKTTLAKRVMKVHPDLQVATSYTTRERRSGEVQDFDYFFLDHEEFETLLEADEFLEHAEVFGNFYGTGRHQVERLRAAGHNVLLEIDWQGARQVREKQPDCCSILILPPTIEALEKRLRARETDSEDVIRHRLSEAVDDISHWNEFDHVVINDDLEQAVATLNDVMIHDGPDTKTTNPDLRRKVEGLLDRNGG